MRPSITAVELVGGPLDGEIFPITISEVGAEIAFPLAPSPPPLSAWVICDAFEPIKLRRADYLVTAPGVATYQGES